MVYHFPFFAFSLLANCGFFFVAVPYFLDFPSLLSFPKHSTFHLYGMYTERGAGGLRPPVVILINQLRLPLVVNAQGAFHRSHTSPDESRIVGVLALLGPLRL